MIAVVFAVLLLGTLLILAPALLDADPADDDAELASYFAQIDALDGATDLSDAERADTRARLERRILARRKSAAAPPRPVLLLGLLAVLSVGAWLAYLPVGRPDLARDVPTVSPEPESLVAELERRLATDRAGDPVGWRLYAGILLEAGRFEEAADALQRALDLGDTSPELPDLVERSRAMAAQQAAMQSLSAEDRLSAITAMVDGLAARLADAPDDPQGWTRLLRSRIALGQTDAAARDAATVADLFADQPEMRDQILRDSGYTEQRNNP